MNNEQQIKQLEECNQELQKQERLLRAQIELQAKQIEALKNKSDEDRFAPHREAGFSVEVTGAYTCGKNMDRDIYYAYRTREQAEWEFKATQVRRKLQNICAVLGPAEDSVSGFNIPGVTEVSFENYYNMKHAEAVLGADMKYLHWNNSPEAKDARKEK